MVLETITWIVAFVLLAVIPILVGLSSQETTSSRGFLQKLGNIANFPLSKIIGILVVVVIVFVIFFSWISGETILKELGQSAYNGYGFGFVVGMLCCYIIFAIQLRGK